MEMQADLFLIWLALIVVRDERDAGGVEDVARSRAGRGNCFGER